MALNANSLSTNLLVTALVLVMVFLLPWADRKICKKLGLSLTGGVSKNPNADTLLRLRTVLLYAAFGAYLLVFCWLVFFSRAASDDYQVHVSLFEDLGHSIRIDLGFLGIIRSIFTEGFQTRKGAGTFSFLKVFRRLSPTSGSSARPRSTRCT